LTRNLWNIEVDTSDPVTPFRNAIGKYRAEFRQRVKRNGPIAEYASFVGSGEEEYLLYARSLRRGRVYVSG
jgi:hypothetical protein